MSRWSIALVMVGMVGFLIQPPDGRGGASPVKGMKIPRGLKPGLSWTEYGEVRLTYELMFQGQKEDEPQVLKVAQVETIRKRERVDAIGNDGSLTLWVEYVTAARKVTSAAFGERVDHFPVEGHRYRVNLTADRVDASREDGTAPKAAALLFIQRDYRPAGRFESMVLLARRVEEAGRKQRWEGPALEQIIGPFRSYERIDWLELGVGTASNGEKGVHRYSCRMKIRSQSSPGLALEADMAGDFWMVLATELPLRVKLKGPVVLKGRVQRPGGPIAVEGKGTMVYEVERDYRPLP